MLVIIVVLPIIKARFAALWGQNIWNSSRFLKVHSASIFYWKSKPEMVKLKTLQIDVDSLAHTISISHTFLPHGNEANRVCLLYLSYLPQPTVTAKCLSGFGSQRTDWHHRVWRIKALWGLASSWPFWTCQTILPHVLCSLLLIQGGAFTLTMWWSRSCAERKQTSHLMVTAHYVADVNTPQNQQERSRERGYKNI